MIIFADKSVYKLNLNTYLNNDFPNIEPRYMHQSSYQTVSQPGRVAVARYNVRSSVSPIRHPGRGFIHTMLMMVAVICFAGCGRGGGQGETLDELYRQVDLEISRADRYMEEKEIRVGTLRKRLQTAHSAAERMRLYDNLIAEYESYISDSALYYTNEAVNAAAAAGDMRECHRLRIKRADIASHAGLFTEAHEMLGAICRAELDTALLGNYYAAYSNLYQYESEYLSEGEYSDRSSQLRNQYIDSLLSVSHPESFEYLSNWASLAISEGNCGAVEKRLMEDVKKYSPGMRQYSILMSILAYMHQTLGHEDQQRIYLAKTVVSDIRGAIKENMAIRELATQVFEDGDIDRANRYLKASFNDANFFSARMRNAQSSRMLPVIDRAYDERQQQLKARQWILIGVISGLLLVLVFSFLSILKQKKRVEEANLNVSKSNEELQAMSGRLKDVNGALEKSNMELKRSNETTVEYAGLFMEFSSLSIASLEKYHLALRNLAVQGNVKGILKKLDSGDIATDTLKMFYTKFDEAILHIYPSFVEKVNALLSPQCQIVPKGSEKLNTELRILALIRIGITDSEQISQFLRCSISTIYTYRSKLKRRSLHPDDFEREVASI